MAAVAVSGLRAIWFGWLHEHEDGEVDMREPFTLDATYLTRLLSAAEAAIEAIRARQSSFHA
jgi:hypothetical protein